MVFELVCPFPSVEPTTVCIAISRSESRSSLTGPQLPGSNPSLPAVHCAGETESETTQGATVEPLPWVTGWVVPTLGNSDASSATAINAGPPSRPWCRGLTGMVSGSRCSPDRCIRVRCIIVIGVTRARAARFSPSWLGNRRDSSDARPRTPLKTSRHAYMDTRRRGVRGAKCTGSH